MLVLTVDWRLVMCYYTRLTINWLMSTRFISKVQYWYWLRS